MDVQTALLETGRFRGPEAGLERPKPAPNEQRLSSGAMGVQEKLRRLTGKAIHDFDMIQEGDLVMVCLSGGADSYTMLDTLMFLQRIAPVRFELVAVNLDQKQPGFLEPVLPEYFTKARVRFKIIEQDQQAVA